MIRNVVQQRIDSYDELEQQLLEAVEKEAAATAAVEEKLKEEVSSATDVTQGKISSLTLHQSKMILTGPLGRTV
jgi:hypothetical protein